MLKELKTKEHIDKVINEHGKEFKIYAWFNDSPDIGFAKTTWNESKKKVLVLFYSDAFVKDCSNTFVAIQAVLRRHFKDSLYIDWCFLPETTDSKRYLKYDLPFTFGFRSRRPIQDFDLVLSSMSIYIEALNVPFMWNYSGIPLEWDERKQDTRLPFILMGGISADYPEWLHGLKGGVPS